MGAWMLKCLNYSAFAVIELDHATLYWPAGLHNSAGITMHYYMYISPFKVFVLCTNSMIVACMHVATNVICF